MAYKSQYCYHTSVCYPINIIIVLIYYENAETQYYDFQFLATSLLSIKLNNWKILDLLV